MRASAAKLDMKRDGEQRTRAAQEAALNRLYQQPSTVRYYRLRELKAAEAHLLFKYYADFKGRRVLDIGIGAGRTTGYLARLAADYTGLERSPAMLAQARQSYPDAKLIEGDMRDLSPLADRSFDSVFLPWNTIDAVSHDDRLKVLSEVRRVLKVGGLFIFSSQNRLSRDAGVGPRLRYSLNPIRQAKEAVRYAVSMRNFLRLRPFEIRHEDYSILNGDGHQFSVLHYYIDPEQQARQLSAAGFDYVECVDENGNSVDGHDSAHAGTIHYVAKSR
jgi:SAM-dependent methyltransferase